eukprot:8014-Prymnesium_polylepis.1
MSTSSSSSSSKTSPTCHIRQYPTEAASQREGCSERCGNTQRRRPIRGRAAGRERRAQEAAGVLGRRSQ